MNSHKSKLIFWSIIWFLSMILGGCLIFSVEGAEWTNEEIVNAIWHTEGGHKARQAYGIEGYNCTRGSCRKIALNTVRNQRVRHTEHTCQYTYLECLSRRYCPPNHRVWLKNVRWFLDNPKEMR